MCMCFDDDTVHSTSLPAQTKHGSTVLTWEIRRENLCLSSMVQVQVKIADSDGGIEHMTKDFFLIGSAVELDDGSEMEYVTPSRLQNSINQAIETVTATVSYVDIDGCPCIYDPEQGIYVRTRYRAGSSNPDGAMSDVCNGVISGATE